MRIFSESKLKGCHVVLWVRDRIQYTGARQSSQMKQDFELFTTYKCIILIVEDFYEKISTKLEEKYLKIYLKYLIKYLNIN